MVAALMVVSIAAEVGAPEEEYAEVVVDWLNAAGWPPTSVTNFLVVVVPPPVALAMVPMIVGADADEALAGSTFMAVVLGADGVVEPPPEVDLALAEAAAAASRARLRFLDDFD